MAKHWEKKEKKATNSSRCNAQHRSNLILLNVCERWQKLCVYFFFIVVVSLNRYKPIHMQLTLELWQWRNIQMKIQVHLNYMATHRLFVHGNSKGQSKARQRQDQTTRMKRTTDCKESYLACVFFFSSSFVQCIPVFWCSVRSKASEDLRHAYTNGPQPIRIQYFNGLLFSVIYCVCYYLFSYVLLIFAPLFTRMSPVHFLHSGRPVLCCICASDMWFIFIFISCDQISLSVSSSLRTFSVREDLKVVLLFCG